MGEPSRHRARSLNGRLFGLAATLAVLTATATAHALPDAGEQTGVDTRRTPVAKNPPGGLITQLAGARYNDDEAAPKDLIEGSPTPFESEFLTVSFANEQQGFAGGMLERDDETRVPVIYRYTDDDGIDVWSEDARFAGRGYVAALAPLPGGRFLAVGGDGSYPYRESTASYCEPNEPPPIDDDPAGRVRVWLYENAAWRELAQKPDGTPGDELPDAMGALTALDSYDNSGKLKGVDFAVAGGLCQLWHWRDGGFKSEPFTPQSKPERLENAHNFAYRVRSVRFIEYVPGIVTERRPLDVVAVTSGCCAPDPREDHDKQRSLLRYVAPADGVHPEKGTWEAPIGGLERQYPESDRLVEDTVTDIYGFPELLYQQGRGFLKRNGVPGSDALPSTLGLPPAPDSDPKTRDIDALPHEGEIWPGELLPDSYYSSTFTQTGYSDFSGPVRSIGLVASPGGESVDPDLDPPSTIENGFQATQSAAQNAAVSGARLVAGDGDTGGGTPSDVPPLTEAAGGDSIATAPDGIPDWVVGRSLATEQAVLVATDPGQLEEPEPAVEAPPVQGAAEALLFEGYTPTDTERAVGATRSYRLLKLPTYGLNAIEMLDPTGVGWAVGKHGAIVKLTVDLTAAEQRRAQDPEPPSLGSRRPAEFPESSAYDEARPAQHQGESGGVPALADQPRRRLEHPALRPVGSGNLREIITSRDGSEAWGFGSQPSAPTLLHYDGERWRRCDVRGVEGQLAPDRECAGLAEVYDANEGFKVAARIPLERDADPTNDEEFEVVALTTERRTLRYRGGRWSVQAPDEPNSVPGGATQLGFRAPDDGWAFDAGTNRLHHYDGEGWNRCTASGDPCDDAQSGRLAGGPHFEPRGITIARDRVYLYGLREQADGIGTGLSPSYPMVIFHERDASGWRGDPDVGWQGDVADGGYDPGFGHTGAGEEPPPPQDRGRVDSLAITTVPSGDYQGWAVGAFGTSGVHSTANESIRIETRPPRASLLRLEAGGVWTRFADTGAMAGYRGGGVEKVDPSRHSVAVGPDGELLALVGLGGRLLGFNSSHERWEFLESGLPPPGAVADVITPDAAGGMWVSAGGHLFHYTDRPPQNVFEEVANPVRLSDRNIVDLEAGAEGAVWIATDSDALYRYDRVLGWDQARVPGWDPARIITRPSRAHALAVNEDGQGIVVGEAGRIADIEGHRIQLDAAAGTACELTAPVPPCGTSRDLLAAAVSPDGSAIAAGRNRSLLWRPAGGEFRSIAWPKVRRTTPFVAAAMPVADRAWLVAETGVVYAGKMTAPGDWTWRDETADARGGTLSVSDIALDSEGHGYAVGEDGLVLERVNEGDSPWRRIDTDSSDNFTSVALAQGGDKEALIGGSNGVIFKFVSGRFQLVRPADFRSSAGRTGSIAGLALAPGVAGGQAEAWAAAADRFPDDTPNRLLHYTSEPAEPLLRPGQRAQALADVPAPGSGDLSFAAFGKSDCHIPASRSCVDFAGTTEIAQVVSSRIRDEVMRRARDDDGPSFALFSGDISDSANLPAANEIDEASRGLSDIAGLVAEGAGAPGKLRSWTHGFADRLQDRGIPVLGAIGSHDLSETAACDRIVISRCASSKEHAKAGDNLAWRQIMESRPEPWGRGSPAGTGAYAFEPVDDPAEDTVGGPQRIDDADAGDPDGERGALDSQQVRTGQARTHYAVDVMREGEAVARVVVVDTSLKSLAASDPSQQPFEPRGQMAFLERMICYEGEQTVTGEECTRERGQHAIVVSNTPTYSYGPGALTDTQTADGTAFEALLLRHEVSVVVSGRLGWNGLYYALAPGLHTPCPGGSYPERPPSGQVPDCAGTGGQSDPVAVAQEKAEELGVDSSLGMLPFVVASGGGGKFGPDGHAQGSSSDGFWHGYTIVRLHPSGDPRKMVVEQRPVYDWIRIDGDARTLLAREDTKLRGVARGPVGHYWVDSTDQGQIARFDRIDSAAVTHRYDLLLADPDEPWVPCSEDDVDCQVLYAKLSAKPGEPGEPVSLASASSASQDGTEAQKNPCSPYLCLPERVASVDRQSGLVKAGNGKYEQTFAIAMLSVGEHVATYPLVFEPSPSFVVTPFEGPPQIPANASPTAPPPPSLPKPQIPSLSLPTPPTLPAIPPLVAQAPPEPQPPAPPAPPPPSQQPSPLNLSVAPTGLTVATPTAVIQPPTPPVNPAPPGGARREARQRQAAAQKSGADSAEEQGVDMADGPPTDEGAQSMTRNEHAATRVARTVSGRSFTPLGRREQPSAWGRGALYGGGLTLMAFALAAGWTRGRPTPRRREPTSPAPAWAPAHRSRR